jgi:hypothetical protein
MKPRKTKIRKGRKRSEKRKKKKKNEWMDTGSERERRK